jgi:hypothetical protein
MKQSLLEEELEKVRYATDPFTEEEVQNSIDKLNTNFSKAKLPVCHVGQF